jgi:hypothetical protein
VGEERERLFIFIRKAAGWWCAHAKEADHLPAPHDRYTDNGVIAQVWTHGYRQIRVAVKPNGAPLAQHPSSKSGIKRTHRAGRSRWQTVNGGNADGRSVCRLYPQADRAVRGAEKGYGALEHTPEQGLKCETAGHCLDHGTQTVHPVLRLGEMAA